MLQLNIITILVEYILSYLPIYLCKPPVQVPLVYACRVPN